jgi:hypothetical protein
MERALDFAEPFFSVRYLLEVEEREVGPRSIVVNLSPQPLRIRDQALAFFRSVIVTNTSLREVRRCLLIEDFERFGDAQELFQRIKKSWVLAYEATREERHRGVALWRSPKDRLGNVEVNMCYADSVPLKVGLHRLHWGDATFKEVHTQIVGYGKMQQCREQDVASLYLEEALAPGATHQPMYDAQGNYPWHQYETITAGVFMPIEMQLGDELGV